MALEWSRPPRSGACASRCSHCPGWTSTDTYLTEFGRCLGEAKLTPAQLARSRNVSASFGAASTLPFRAGFPETYLFCEPWREHAKWGTWLLGGERDGPWSAHLDESKSGENVRHLGYGKVETHQALGEAMAEVGMRRAATWKSNKCW